jgi:putative transposase
VIDEDVDKVIKETCEGLELRYDIVFLEVGTDLDHIHFLIQSVPSYSVTKIVRMVKSILSREVFRRCPKVKKALWGGEFFGKAYYTNTVGQHGTESMISNYVKNQGRVEEYSQLKVRQLNLFE